MGKIIIMMLVAIFATSAVGFGFSDIKHLNPLLAIMAMMVYLGVYFGIMLFAVMNQKENSMEWFWVYYLFGIVTAIMVFFFASDLGVCWRKFESVVVFLFGRL